MFHLQRNLPGWERIARLATGAIVAVAAAVLGAQGVSWWLAIAVAATLALTAFVGFCPACAMLGRRPARRAP